jgi:hypothetical protein
LLGIASASCFGAPPDLACVLQLHAPPRCWCAYAGHFLLGAPTRRVKRTSWPDASGFWPADEGSFSVLTLDSTHAFKYTFACAPPIGGCGGALGFLLFSTELRAN